VEEEKQEVEPLSERSLFDNEDNSQNVNSSKVQSMNKSTGKRKNKEDENMRNIKTKKPANKNK
jgi:hypothetical protein